MSKISRTAIVLVLVASVDALALAAEVANPSVAFIQRTMTRIAQSTPQNPATVRFQFYGQSITAQAWTGLVGKDLAQRFPSVKFTFHNPAIGGFTSPALIRTAEHDLYPWYPDILVFHVYGPVDKYEEIIRNVRARTTAEIVLWTSHLSAAETLDKNPDDDARIVAIRAIAKKYDCLLIDVRKKWIAYIQEHHLEPKALLNDSVHLNQEGVKLMASFIGSELIPAPGLATTAQAGTVTDIPLDSPAVARDAAGDLTLTFTGNRVVAISGGAGGEGRRRPVGRRTDGRSAGTVGRHPPQHRSPDLDAGDQAGRFREGPARRRLDADLPERLDAGRQEDPLQGDRLAHRRGWRRLQHGKVRLPVGPRGDRAGRLAPGVEPGLQEADTPRGVPGQVEDLSALHRQVPAAAGRGGDRAGAELYTTTHTLTLKGSAGKLGITGFRVYAPAPLAAE